MIMKQDTWTLQRKFFKRQILSYLPLAAQKFTSVTPFSEYHLANFLKEKSAIKLTNLVLTLWEKLRICQPEKIQGQLQLALALLQVDNKMRLMQLVKTQVPHIGPVHVKRKRTVAVSVAKTNLRSMPDQII